MSQQASIDGLSDLNEVFFSARANRVAGHMARHLAGESMRKHPNCDIWHRQYKPCRSAPAGHLLVGTGINNCGNHVTLYCGISWIQPPSDNIVSCLAVIVMTTCLLGSGPILFAKSANFT